jgi:hypothetical protein
MREMTMAATREDHNAVSDHEIALFFPYLIGCETWIVICSDVKLVDAGAVHELEFKSITSILTVQFPDALNGKKS